MGRELTFDEFKSKFVEYITTAFNILDRNKDESIDEVLTNDSIEEYSLHIFEELLKNVVEYFDNDEDESISTEDFFPSGFSYSDRNKDGKVTISELIGHSLINLPAPIYTAYRLLDEDQDEIFTLDELLGFLWKTFKIIDKNGDCYFNLEEIIVALGESGLPDDFQLGVKLIGQQYLTLGKYFINGIIDRADVNNDKKVDLEEVVKFSDFSFIESSVYVAKNMASPNYPTLSYITGLWFGYGSGPRPRSEDEQRALVVWLTTMNNFLENTVYTTVPAPKCGPGAQ